MTYLDAGPLAGLVLRHRAGRTYAELADASGGVISPAAWEELVHLPLRSELPLDHVLVAAVALALNLTEGTVRHYLLASRRPEVLERR
jgi:hypothetical protein